MPRAPRPQTRRCRFADERGQCRAVATHGEVCGTHARELEDAIAAPAPSLVEDLLAGLLGGPAVRPRLERLRDDLATRLGDIGEAAVRRMIPGAPPPAPAPRPTGPPPPSSPPRRPPSPEAIARRRKLIETCALLGLDADSAFTADDVRRAHMRRARLCHVDGQAPDPEREKMLRQVNDAKTFLVAYATERAARAKPPAQ